MNTELHPEFTLTGSEGGADVATPLGASDRLQPDVVLGGAGELSHAVGGCRWAQHHFLVHANTLGHAHKNSQRNQLSLSALALTSQCQCLELIALQSRLLSQRLHTLIVPSAEEKVRV